MLSTDIIAYHDTLSPDDRAICERLADEITSGLPQATAKVWHAHPVWFLDGNPIVGYSRQKAGIRLMFWSGRGFDEAGLIPGKGRFQDASAYYTTVDDIDSDRLARWLSQSIKIQWDYKNIVKQKGKLVRIV